MTIQATYLEVFLFFTKYQAEPILPSVQNSDIFYFANCLA